MKCQTRVECNQIVNCCKVCNSREMGTYDRYILNITSCMLHNSPNGNFATEHGISGLGIKTC